MNKINKFEYLLEALHKGASQEIHETVHQTVRRRQLDLNIMFTISVFSFEQRRHNKEYLLHHTNDVIWLRYVLRRDHVAQLAVFH